MLLLNLTAASAIAALQEAFTFQYASIKPRFNRPIRYMPIMFTFQYASIKPFFHCYLLFVLMSLHFNMLLLNLLNASPYQLHT